MTRKTLSEWGSYNSETGQYELDISKATKTNQNIRTLEDGTKEMTIDKG
jgi:hypothetical protein